MRSMPSPGQGKSEARAIAVAAVLFVGERARHKTLLAGRQRERQRPTVQQGCPFCTRRGYQNAAAGRKLPSGDAAAIAAPRVSRMLLVAVERRHGCRAMRGAARARAGRPGRASAAASRRVAPRVQAAVRQCSPRSSRGPAASTSSVSGSWMVSLAVPCKLPGLRVEADRQRHRHRGFELLCGPAQAGRLPARPEGAGLTGAAGARRSSPSEPIGLANGEDDVGRAADKVLAAGIGIPGDRCGDRVDPRSRS